MSKTPASLEVRPVQTRADKKLFLKLPWELYAQDPNWVPPLRMVQKELVGYARHPFYADAIAQTFLALRNGRPCGRISAIINHAHIRQFNEQRGFFGFFECENDVAAAEGLFGAARGWLASHGAHLVRGPMNPSINYEMGLLIDGFDSPPTFMMTYNPPFYSELIEHCGFRKAQDMYAFWGHTDMLGSLDQKLSFIADEATRRFGVTVRKMNPKKFDEEVRTFLRIYNDSLRGMWSFVPLSAGEIDEMAGVLKYLVIPEITSIAEVNGVAVGTAFGMLDYNPLIKEIDGRLFPFGFIKLLRGKKRLTKIRLIAANVVSEYQRWGLGLVLLNRMVPDVLAWGVRECEFSWVLESNHLSRASLERGGAKRYKTYRIYDYPPPVASESKL